MPRSSQGAQGHSMSVATLGARLPNHLIGGTEQRRSNFGETSPPVVSLQ
ncbi:hypothetical protein [Streptomyces sp. NPDC048462]